MLLEVLDTSRRSWRRSHGRVPRAGLCMCRVLMVLDVILVFLGVALVVLELG